MTSRGSPSFLDRFTLHLAANLLGSQTVFDRLSNDDAPKPPPLYWRSSFLDDPLASLMEGASTEADNKQQLFFVDLTFDFVVQEKVPMLTVCFGCFLKQRQPTCLYVRGSPLTIMQLERHAQSVGIDLHSAPPKAMAGMMAKELIDILKSKQQYVPIKMEEAQFHLPLYYRDVEESGTISMDIEQTTSQFDRLGMSLLFFSGSFNSQNSPENNDEVPEQELITKLEEWFQQQKQKTLEQDEQSLFKSTKNTVTTTKETVKPASSVSSVKNPRPTSQVHHYAQLPSKRRKKGKISYAKPTSK